MSKVKVKICGLTSVTDAEYLNRYNADLAGIVLFFEKSRRNMPLEEAEKIIAVLDRNISSCAVVVSPTVEQIDRLSNTDFDYIQVHGELTEEVYQHCAKPILKAFNVNDLVDFQRFADLEKIVGFVFDAAQYGSGKTFDWGLLKTIDTKDKLVVLAGGLNTENVCAAVLAVKPDIVDVSTGVESENKHGKDPEKIKKFIENAKSVDISS